MDNLAGRVAFVTGGASGIGLGIALCLARRGVNVGIADIDTEASDRALAQLQALGGRHAAVRLDVTSRDSWGVARESVAGSLGPVDILCNNAGVGSSRRPTEEIPDADWRWVFETNVHGVYNGIAAMVPGMKARGTGHVVNTASILGCFPMAGASDYVAAKYAVVGLSEALRLELRESGIGVSVLCPGLVDTNITANTHRYRAAHTGSSPSGAKHKPNRGLNPMAAGEAVADAIAANRLYVFTHPEYVETLTRWKSEMTDAIGAAERRGDPDDLSYLTGDLARNWAAESAR